MNYLIAGLGNIGDEYDGTRHNIGFRILDALAKASNIVFDDRRYGFVATLPVKNQTLTLLKPSTYMNLSGNAVRYWMKEKNIPIERLLVVVDDLSLPFGQIRLKLRAVKPATTACATSPRCWARSSMPASALASATIFRGAVRWISYWGILARKTWPAWTSVWVWRARPSRVSAWPASRLR